MHVRADTLDDLLREVFERLRVDGAKVVPSKGANKELFGVVLELDKPLERYDLVAELPAVQRQSEQRLGVSDPQNILESVVAALGTRA